MVDRVEADNNLDRVVVAATVTDRYEAEVARAALADAGIEAIVQADDAGGNYPNLSVTEGVRILVRAEDLEEAQTVLSGAGSW